MRMEWIVGSNKRRRQMNRCLKRVLPFCLCKKQEPLVFFNLND